MTRRGLLKASMGALAGGAILRPQPAMAFGNETNRATISQGAVPFMIEDSISAFTTAPQAQFAGCIATMANVPDQSRGTSFALNLRSAGPFFGARADWRPAAPIRVGDSDTIEFWAYLESPAQWPNGSPTSGAQGFLYLANASFTQVLSAFYCLRKGWNHIRIGKNQFTPVAGNPSWDSDFNVMRISVSPCSEASSSTYFGEFRKGGKDRPLVCMIFDDGEDCVRTNALPIMQAAGIPMTLALISGNMGRTLGYRTFSSTSQLSDFPDGTVFVNHTKNHSRSILDQKKTPYSLILNEIQSCQQALSGVTGFDPTMFCAPYGEWSEKYLQALTESGILMSRSTVSGSGPGFRRHTGSRLDNPLIMPSYAIVKNDSPEDVLAFVDQGIQSSQGMILTFHDIRPTASFDIDYTIANFQAIVDGLVARAGQVDFVTMPGFYQRLKANGLT